MDNSATLFRRRSHTLRVFAAAAAGGLILAGLVFFSFSSLV